MFLMHISMFLTPQLTKQVAAEGPGLGLERGGDGPTAGWNSSARTAPARRAPPRVIERGVGEGKVEGRRGGGADVGAPRRGSGAQIGAERSMFFF